MFVKLFAKTDFAILRWFLSMRYSARWIFADFAVVTIWLALDICAIKFHAISKSIELAEMFEIIKD